MKNAYRTKRLFWHNLKNFDFPDIPFYGADEIIVAGFEFVLCDSNCHPKNIFVAVNSLGDSQMYYETSTNKVGNIHGDKTKIFTNLARTILNEISELTYNMDQCKNLPACPKLDFVNFYALGHKGKFCKSLTYCEIRFSKHPYYPLYIYFMQLINEMRKVALKKL